MAVGKDVSPETNIYFKCYPNLKFSIVVCIILAKNIKGAIFLTEVLELCPAHKEFYLFSKISSKSFSDEAKQISPGENFVYR